jgi:large subunit ribosomal protein L6
VKFGSFKSKNMSRVGKKAIIIPSSVKVQANGRILSAKGEKGELSLTVPPQISFALAENKITFSLEPVQSGRQLTSKEKKRNQSLWGLTRNLMVNMLEGVSRGYEKRLEIEGLGYRASLESGDLVLLVGFSHPLRVKKTEGIQFGVEKNVIVVSGVDKALVGQTAATIRSLRPPDPYKAKGIRYLGEVIKKKAGKKASTVTK